MTRNKANEQSNAPKAKYEPPAIVQSASFERLALACARTPAEYAEGECGAPEPMTANS